MIRFDTLAALAASCAVLLAPHGAAAQQGITAPGFTAKPILVSPLAGDDAKEIVVIATEIAPGASSPAHTHPGHCIVTVQSGMIEVRVEGRAPRRLGAGDAIVNPPGPVHQFFNVGEVPVRMTQTLLVEKGKPRTVTFPTPLD
jgi:quercetin dioxygenase-like cupin family protein